MANRKLKRRSENAFDWGVGPGAPTAQVRAADVLSTIEAAFALSAGMDARKVSVLAHDGTVILVGTVRSWAEREEAERVAWTAPGVTHVDQRLSISPY